MKIVFLSYLNGFGGAEKQIILLANAMAEKGHKVTLVSIYENNLCYELNNKVKYIFLPDRKEGVLRLYTRYVDIRNTLKEINPDITVNFWFQSAYFTAMMKKSITGKVIYSERGDPGDKEYNGIMGQIRKFVFPKIDGFVFQSEGAKNFFDDIIQKRSVVINNPVFVKRSDYPNVIKREKKIVTMGRLHEQKNQKLLINAFASINDEFKDYNLYIYGDGELKKELQDLIDSYNLTKRILLKGAQKDVHGLIYNASLFVLSSDYEGLPNALIEAMALGIPSISTDCKPGGAREIIHNYEDGIIVPINDVQKLANSMRWMLNNPLEAGEMGKKAFQNIRRLDSCTIYQKWSDYFEKVIGKK